MKKQALFAAVLILIGAATFTACNDELINQNSDFVEFNEFDTTSNFATEPLREISIDEARENLENILSELDFSISKSGKIRKIASELTLTSKSNSLKKSSSNDEDSLETKLYVFNFENEEGFALMSATTATPSLLALTKNGTIDTTQEIDDSGLILFLEHLENYLAEKNDTVFNYYEDYKETLSKKYHKTTEYNFYSPQGGYCSVKWGQGYPYNKYCKYKKEGDTYTGCVATALAQLLSTYKFPETYNGYIFDWNNMIAGKNDDKVARLMQQLGLSQNLAMKYGEESSGSSIEKIPRTLKNLGFSNSGDVVGYDFDKVISELKKGNSVVAAGFAHIKNKGKKILGIRVSNTTYASGHDWLIHGAFTLTTKIHSTHSKPHNTTTIDNYVLCNWGWDGSSDGYYLSGVFDTNKSVAYDENFYPKSLSKNTEEDYYYQYKLRIIINVKQ